MPAPPSGAAGTAPPSCAPKASWLTPLGALVIAIASILMARRWADFDVFWHLANGRLMVEQGRFPSPDAFSWSVAGQPVVAYSAPVERLFFVLWRAAGPRGLGFYSALTFTLVMLPPALLVGRLRLRPIVEGAALVVLALALVPYGGARPHVAAFAIAGFIGLLLTAPFGTRAALIAGALLGVWVLTHGSFVLGFCMVGVAAVLWAADRDARSAANAMLAIAIGFGLSALSPIGMSLWLAPLGTATHPLLATVNQDWMSLRPIDPSYAGMGAILLLAILVGVGRRADPRGWSAAGLGLLTIQVARITGFSAPLLLACAMERLAERVPWVRLPVAAPIRATLASHGSAALAWTIAIAGVVLATLLTPAAVDPAATDPDLPEAAVSRLLACGRPAPVWNDYNWGGYLIWRGGAAFPVGIDGRAETAYPLATLTDYLEVADATSGWQSIITGSPAHYAIWPTDARADIAGLPGWRTVYRDDVATVVARDDTPWRCADGPAGSP